MTSPAAFSALAFQPLDLGLLLLLNRIDAPLLKGSLGSNPLDLVNQAFCFSEPEAAHAAILISREEFDRQSFAFSRQFAPDAFPSLAVALSAHICTFKHSADTAASISADA